MLNCSGQELRQNLNLQGNESVLDVGCGDGKITADFATTLPRSRWLARQFSWNDCLCDSHLCVKAVSNLSFACVDARSLDFDQEFVLFSNATLHWVDNHKHFLTVRVDRCGVVVASYFLRWSGDAADVLQVFLNSPCESWQSYFHNPTMGIRTIHCG